MLALKTDLLLPAGAASKSFVLAILTVLRHGATQIGRNMRKCVSCY